MCKHCTVRLVDYYWITKVGTRTVRSHYCLDDPSTDLRAGSAAAGGKNYRRFAESNLSQLEIVLAGRTLEGHAVATVALSTPSTPATKLPALYTSLRAESVPPAMLDVIVILDAAVARSGTCTLAVEPPGIIKCQSK